MVYCRLLIRVLAWEGNETAMPKAIKKRFSIETMTRERIVLSAPIYFYRIVSAGLPLLSTMAIASITAVI